MRRNEVIAAGSEVLWAEAHERIVAVVQEGWVAGPSPDPTEGGPS